MAKEFNKDKHKFNNIRFRSTDLTDYLDWFLRLVCLNYKEEKRLTKTQRKIMAGLIERQKKEGIIKDNAQWREFMNHLIQKGIVSSSTVLSTEKHKLKKAGWIAVKDQKVTASKKLVDAIFKGYIVVSLAYKEKPVLYEPELLLETT